MPFCLTAPPTPTLFGVFAFHHRRSPFITGVCTPSIRCFYNSSLSILACIGKVFACYLHQEHKRLPVVQTLTVSALSFIWEHFFSLHLLSHYSTSLDPTGTPAQSPCALVQFLFSRFLPRAQTRATRHTRLLHPDELTRPEYQTTRPTCQTRIRMTSS
jgi:hypothetical protein